MIGANTIPIGANLRAAWARSGVTFGVCASCAVIAALTYGSWMMPMTTTMTARATNGARKRGFSRTRWNTAVGSYSTRKRSSTASMRSPEERGAVRYASQSRLGRLGEVKQVGEVWAGWGGWGRLLRCNLPHPPEPPKPPQPVSRVEARGIEPRSENDSETATTCVGKALEVSPPRRLAGLGGN